MAMATVKIQLPRRLQSFLNALKKEGYAEGPYILHLLAEDRAHRLATGWTPGGGWKSWQRDRQLERRKDSRARPAAKAVRQQ